MLVAINMVFLEKELVKVPGVEGISLIHVLKELARDMILEGCLQSVFLVIDYFCQLVNQKVLWTEGILVWLDRSRIMISITSAIELMSAMFRWLLRFLRSLPDFCIITTVAVFYGVGKYWYLRPQLNILVNARRVWSEKC
ncbi:hypothetical protein QTP88_026059 [Uroleucon formosanum]